MRCLVLSYSLVMVRWSGKTAYAGGQDYESDRFGSHLLGQLGLEHTAFTFSRNVLGSDYKYPFAFYSFNNGFSFRDSTGVTVFDNNSGSILLMSLKLTSPVWIRVRRYCKLFMMI